MSARNFHAGDKVVVLDLDREEHAGVVVDGHVTEGEIRVVIGGHPTTVPIEAVHHAHAPPAGPRYNDPRLTKVPGTRATGRNGNFGLARDVSIKAIAPGCPHAGTYRLKLWETGIDHGSKQRLGYALYAPKKKTPLFAGEDFFIPLHKEARSDGVLRDLLAFLTLAPGDTDASYFDKYTPDQLSFARSGAACDIADRYVQGDERATRHSTESGEVSGSRAVQPRKMALRLIAKYQHGYVGDRGVEQKYGPRKLGYRDAHAYADSQMAAAYKKQNSRKVNYWEDVAREIRDVRSEENLPL